MSERRAVLLDSSLYSDTESVDQAFPMMADHDKCVSWCQNTGLLRVEWTLRKPAPAAVICKPAPARADRPFWDNPVIMNDIFGPPEKWAPLAIARMERAYRG